MLDIGCQSDYELAKPARPSDPLQRGQTVDRDSLGLELFENVFHSKQVIFEACHFRIFTDHSEQPLMFHPLEIGPPASRVAEQLFAAFFERKEQTPFPFPSAAIEKLRRR